MQVILLKDIPKIGRKYEVKNISDGYVRNFLLPRKLAEVATPNTIANIEKKKEKEGISKNAREETINKNIAKLKGIKISIKEKANEKGHLFATVKPEEIVNALKEKNIEISADMMEINEPIKEIGEKRIVVRSPNGKIKSEFVLEVLSL